MFKFNAGDVLVFKDKSPPKLVHILKIYQRKYKSGMIYRIGNHMTCIDEKKHGGWMTGAEIARVYTLDKIAGYLYA